MAFDVVLTPGFKKDLKHIAKKHKQILKGSSKNKLRLSLLKTSFYITDIKF